MDDDPKHTAEITQEFMKAKKWDVLQEPSQSPDLSTTELYSYWSSNWMQRNHKQAATEFGLREHLKGGNSICDYYGF